MSKKISEDVEGSIHIGNIVKSVMIAFVMTFIVFVFMALILVNVEFPETLLASFVIVSVVISVLFGAILLSRANKKNGLLNGVLVGIGYIVILYLVSVMSTGNIWIGQSGINILISSILSGGIGGIIGVNIR